jgi:hypothetical protein
MKLKYAFLLTAFVLSGCGESSSSTSQASTGSSAALKSHLTLADGSQLALKGTHLKTYKKPNAAGSLSMHEFSYPSLDKIAENDFYANIKSAGYTRKIIKSDNTQYKVQYYKKDNPVVGGIFTNINRNGKDATIAIIYWQEK